MGFKEIRKIKDGKSYIYMGNDNKALIGGVGTYQLKLTNKKTFDPKECLYAPGMRRNLLSVECLKKLCFLFYFGNEKFVMNKV